MEFKVRDWVMISTQDNSAFKIIEYRGAFGPGGAEVWRLRRGLTQVEVLESQMTFLMTNSLYKQLKAIKARYFSPSIAHPNGRVWHHSDCYTHRSMEVYKYAPCTCGLLHDLKVLPGDYAKKILPTYNDDYDRQEAMVPGSFYWKSPEEQEVERKSCKKLLSKMFPGYEENPGPNPDDETERKVIQLVFDI